MNNNSDKLQVAVLIDGQNLFNAEKDATPNKHLRFTQCDPVLLGNHVADLFNGICIFYGYVSGIPAENHDRGELRKKFLEFKMRHTPRGAEVWLLPLKRGPQRGRSSGDRELKEKGGDFALLEMAMMAYGAAPNLGGIVWLTADNDFDRGIKCFESHRQIVAAAMGRKAQPLKHYCAYLRTPCRRKGFRSPHLAGTKPIWPENYFKTIDTGRERSSIGIPN